MLAEVQAIDRARRDVLGAGYDGVLLAPAFFEAGRFTRGDVHYAGETPVGETEFAQDATFGYSSSNLVDFVAEKGGGEALSLSPGDELPPVRDGQWVVVNAESYDDLDAVVRAARASGRVLLYRTGPSFVRALAGLDERPPLSEVPRREGHGLVVVGSHVGLTSRQVAAAQERCGLIEIELDVNELDVDGRVRAGRRRARRRGRPALHEPQARGRRARLLAPGVEGRDRGGPGGAEAPGPAG